MLTEKLTPYNSNLFFYNKNNIRLSRSQIDSLSNTIKNTLNSKSKVGTLFKFKPDDINVYSVYEIIVINNVPFCIIQKLGEGAFGKVYKGFNLKSGEYVAIKEQSLLYKNIIELQTSITKKHGIGIAKKDFEIIGPEYIGKSGYFILPLAEGDLLRYYKNNINILTDYQIIDHIIDIIKDLSQLHISGYTHMDLKIDNVLLLNNKACLSDFGKCELNGKMINSVMASHKKYPHCAPEYFKEFNKEISGLYRVDCKFDYWSLGKLIKDISVFVKDSKVKLSLINISKGLLNYNPSQRTNLFNIHAYLNNLKIHLM